MSIRLRRLLPQSASFLLQLMALRQQTALGVRTPYLRGHVEVCRELLASVASVDIEDTKHTTPLLLAVENNRAKVAQVLCEAGASTSVGLQTSGTFGAVASSGSCRSALWRGIERQIHVHVVAHGCMVTWKR